MQEVVRRVSPFVAVASRAFQTHATYRAATFAGIVTNTMFGFVYAYVYGAVHVDVGPIDGYAAEETMLYVFGSQAFLAMTGAFGDREISDRIRTGDIAADLYRPVDFQTWWLSQSLGKAAYMAIFRGIPPFVVGAAVLQLPLPSAPAVWAGFALTAFLGVVLSFGVRFLANLSGFWLLDGRGVITLVTTLQVFLAGHVVPLYFLPEPFESIARSTPFAGITALPVETLLGRHQGPALARVVLIQIGWSIVLLLAGRLVLRRAYRRLVLQGG